MPEQTIFIQDFRLSYIWVETVLDFIRNNIPPENKFTFLRSPQAYASKFEEIQNKEAVGLQPPWPLKSKGHHFWSRYLETSIPGTISKNTVWKKQVPFYHKIDDLTIDCPTWLSGRITIHAFIYPYSIALIFSAECNNKKKTMNLTLDEIISLAKKVNTEKFLITQQGKPNKILISLESLANQELKKLHKFILGSTVQHQWSVPNPFSIVTVVQGSGVEREEPPTPTIIKFLDYLAHRPTSYDDWKNPPNESVISLNETDKDKIRDAYAGDMLFIAPRGRVVWYPKYFTKKDKRINKLSCYHKNLTLLSMQIESMGQLVDVAAEEINAGNSPNPASFYEQSVKRAAINLSLLYVGGGKKKKTYRSWSAKRQIEQNNFLNAINIIRDKLCNLMPLE